MVYNVFLKTKLKKKKRKKVVATFILFEEYSLKGLNFRNYLKGNKDWQP